MTDSRLKGMTNERDGYRWVTAIKYGGPMEMVSRFPAEALGITVDGQPAEIGPVEGFLVADSHNLSEVAGEFATADEAAAHAKALNDADASKHLSIDPVSVARRDRLKALGETFWVRYGEGAAAGRWPSEPARYAVESWSDRYSESFWKTCGPDELEGGVLSGEVSRIVDLDTGEDVPFTLTATIGNLEGGGIASEPRSAGAPTPVANGPRRAKGSALGTDAPPPSEKLDCSATGGADDAAR